MNAGHEVIKQVVSNFMNAHTKALVLKSLYGSGQTTFMQRLIHNHKPERVWFLTYRQTLARDIMRNFEKLKFKNYLDACDDPSIWDAPRVIIQTW